MGETLPGATFSLLLVERRISKTLSARFHHTIEVKFESRSYLIEAGTFGPFLTEYDWLDDNYDLLGHLHCKKTPQVDADFGQTWRRFLWRNLLGEGYPMMDVIAKCFEDDSELGLVFPDDPNIFGWMTNKEPVARLAKKMKLTVDLPRAFDFPVGTMFWCRPAALRPLFDLGLGWDQYPFEPLPGDGTILHAIERLLPFIVRHERYLVAATNVSGLTR